MAKDVVAKRKNGCGTIKKRSNRKNPYMALVFESLVPDGAKKYKSIGSFKTRKEAEEALEMYYQNPMDYTSKIKTFEDLYKVWSEQYFRKVTPTCARTIKSCHRYCFITWRLRRLVQGILRI